MSIIDTLITDRTQADVNRLYELAAKSVEAMTGAERNEYLTSKGGYKHTDLNRVESAVAYLAGVIQNLPDELKQYAADKSVAWGAIYDVPYDPDDYNPTTRTNWQGTDIPTITDMDERYLANVELLITALEASYPTLPVSIEDLSYTGANAIERALVVLYGALLDERARITKLLDNTAASFVYSGGPYSGQIWSEFSA